jgi:hypothetical protein
LFCEPEGAVETGQDDAGGSLNVVVEGTESVLETSELLDGVSFEKVFPLKDGVRKNHLNGGYELIDESLIGFSTYPLVSHSQIQWIRESLFVVRSYIQCDG